MLEPKDWHKRFAIQVEWTSSVRNYLIHKIPNKQDVKAIEIGCGTGAILNRVENDFPNLFGLDINFDYLSFAKKRKQERKLICGDGYKLPVPHYSFDVVFCHFLLLWISSPGLFVQELYRILKNGGVLLLFAEPDYGGRIDYPPALEQLGTTQTKSLQQQGADPFVGRKLRDLITTAGFVDVQVGVLGNEWTTSFDPVSWESEWRIFDHDLANLIPKQDLTRLKQIDLAAHKNEKRILYVPTFFASAKK